MIRVESLTFDYPGKRALHDVSFSIEQGSITALVGPNGAGKTTLLRCIAALEQPMSGSILVDNIDVQENPRQCHRKLGYLSDFFGLYDQLTVEQCFRFVGLANDLNPNKLDEAITETARYLELEDRLSSPTGKLSRGLRQRVAIGQAIIHSPEIIILDEPASGLDPEARYSLANLFTRLQNRGMTLIISSHILAELEAYSTDMLILRDGRIIEHRHLDSNRSTKKRIRISLSVAAQHLEKILIGIEGISQLQCNNCSATFLFDTDKDQQTQLLKSLIELGLPICEFGIDKHNLQDAYLATLNAEQEKQP